MFVLTKIAWKQGKQGQNTNIVFDQTAGTGNLKPFTWETPPFRDCTRIANRLRRNLGQDYSGRECRTLNSARR